jgi:hypothetical protein
MDNFELRAPVTDMDLTLFTMRQHMIGATNTGVDLRRTAICLRVARQMGIYDEVLAEVLAARAEWRAWEAAAQRKWQTRVSRRPARGNHHDSWSIRESYVRYGMSRLLKSPV